MKRPILNILLIIICYSCINTNNIDIRHYKVNSIEKIKNKKCIVLVLSTGKEYGEHPYIYDDDMRIIISNNKYFTDSLFKAINRNKIKRGLKKLNRFIQPAVVTSLLDHGEKKFAYFCDSKSCDTWGDFLDNLGKFKINGDSMLITTYNGDLFKLKLNSDKVGDTTQYEYYTLPFCILKNDSLLKTP